jgi:hypothetical protein
VSAVNDKFLQVNDILKAGTMETSQLRKAMPLHQ